MIKFGKFALCMIFVLLAVFSISQLSFAFSPQDNINLRGIYAIFNGTDINATDFYGTDFYGTTFHGTLNGSFSLTNNLNLNNYDVFNATNINATNIFQNGNAVLDSTYNSSVYAYIDSQDTTYNASIKTYVDAQNIIFNDSMKNYVDTQGFSNSTLITYINAQDVIYNNSMKVYVDAQDLTYNNSIKTYVDAQNLIFNSSLKNYADATFITQANEGNLNVNSSTYWGDLLNVNAIALNWTQLQNYPVSCPSGTFATQLDDTITCTAPTAADVDAGTFPAGNFAFTGGTLDADTLNTGQGDYELYAMNQNVQTTDSPTFNTVTATDNIQATNNVTANRFDFNNTANICIFYNGSAIIINNNAAGVTCP